MLNLVTRFSAGAVQWLMKFYHSSDCKRSVDNLVKVQWFEVSLSTVVESL